MDEFKGVLDQYTDLNSRLDTLNKQVYQLREQRKIKELEIIDFLKQPQFSQFNVIERPDGSKLSVKRPQTWSKPWSLSKNELYRLIREYFTVPGEKRAETCYTFITRAVERESRSNEFKIELK
jgi:hypothetical protein